MFSTSKLFLSSKNKINATGGTITYSGDYVIHTFTSNDILDINGDGYIDVLVVAGGGGGGSNSGAGGGGAGGLIYISQVAIMSGSYSVAVGLGGLANQNGGNSSIFSYTAIGGGRGGYGLNGDFDGGAGGSGGGAGHSETGRMPGTGTVGQGNSGGFAYDQVGRLGSTNVTTRGGGGGGGAAAIGTNAFGLSNLAVQGGNGGNGRLIDITGSNIYYAGGGAGNGFGASTSAGGGPGSGGLGGGGSNSNGTNGLGGGGSGNGYSGGSGIVIVRYLK